MLWVVTLSLFLPSFTSSCVVCANPSAGQELSNAAHSKIFFMTSSRDCACDRLLHYIKDQMRSRVPPLGPRPMEVTAAVKRPESTPHRYLTPKAVRAILFATAKGARARGKQRESPMSRLAAFGLLAGIVSASALVLPSHGQQATHADTAAPSAAVPNFAGV